MNKTLQPLDLYILSAFQHFILPLLTVPAEMEKQQIFLSLSHWIPHLKLLYIISIFNYL